MLLSAVSLVGLPRFLIPTAMSDPKYIYTSWLEVMIFSNYKLVFIRDLNHLALQIIFDTWLASMNVGSKHPIPWNNSRHASSWLLYLHHTIEETGSPGMICIICHPVRRHPSEHRTSSMEQYLLAKADITKVNQVTELEVTELTSLTVDETALAIMKRQRSRGFTIVSSQRNFIFFIQVNPYWPNWQTKRSKLAPMGFETS